MVVLAGEVLVELRGTNAVAHPGLAYAGGLGGAVLHTAAILARVGLPTRFVGEVGEDFLGRWALAQISGNRIETRFVRARPELGTHLRLVELGEKGHSSLYRVYGETRFEPDSAAMARARWFHFGSSWALEARNAEGLLHLLEIALEHDIPVSFDPSLEVSPGEEAWAQIQRYMPFVSVLKASLNDARRLFPLAPDDPQVLLEHLVELGAPVTVLTLGAAGAMAAFRTRMLRVPGVKVTVMDTQGAGEAFSAGLIYGFLKHELSSRLGLVLWEGTSLPVILASACHLAAITCTVEGPAPPEPGLNAWWERFG
ncbi:carbohydrate kinase [Meiothermus sp. QL-1]|uniref:carbohydrate kinase family protein n=1 Tax=Meiothermus sp. QL-1 TaxID=2058095 RepID=UPI000E0C2615|nr:PfkB family carbohydrate kinase [Meiothermus sp. QL-1]RDI96261.1 carbohydrate kinase [Meiothermus sp. QL-1]